MLKFNHLTRWMIVVQIFLVTLFLFTIVLWNQNEEFVLETILSIWWVRNSICKTEESSMQICRQYVDTYSSKHTRLTKLQRECFELQKTQTNKDSDKQRLTTQRQTLGVCFCLFTVFALIIPCFMPRELFSQGNLLNHQRLNSV